jgi:polyribonucleotide nucleotidyltransferase
MPDALACLAASAALAVSDIPIKEVISEVRVARVNGRIYCKSFSYRIRNC